MLFASKPNPITNTGNQRLDLGFLELHQWKKGTGKYYCNAGFWI